MKAILVSTIVATLLLIQVMCEPMEAIKSCGEVNTQLRPCVSYLTNGNVGEPGEECCKGVKELFLAAQSTFDKRDICNCVKASANQISNLKDDAAKALPAKCGVGLLIPISKNINCDSVN